MMTLFFLAAMLAAPFLIWRVLVWRDSHPSRRCRREHSRLWESRQTFYDGTRVVWCPRCRKSWWLA